MSSRFFNTDNPHEAFLHEMEDEYFMGELIYDDAHQPVDFRFLEVNASFLRNKGFTVEEVLNNTYLQLFHWLSHELIELCAASMQSGQYESGQFSLIEQGIYALVRVKSHGDNKFVALVTNLNKIKTSSEDFEILNQKLLIATELSDAAVFEYDIHQNRVISANQRFYDMMGFKNSDQIFRNFVAQVHPEDQGALMKKLDLLNNPSSVFKVYEYEYRYLHPVTHEWRVHKNKSYILRNSQTLSWFGFTSDITKEKKILNDVKNEKELVETILSKSIAAFTIIDASDRKVKTINEAFTKITGYSREEIIQMDAQTRIQIVKPEYQSKTLEAQEKALQGESLIPVELELLHKQGYYVYCYIVYSPFHVAPTGEILSIMGSFIDITALKEQEKKVIAANLQKDRFLSNMSHEIRTPLNAVLGFSRLLQKNTASPDKQHAFLEQIEQNSQQLLMLVNDILDLSKIESDNLVLQPTICDLHQCLSDMTCAATQKLKEIGKDGAVKIHFKSPKKSLHQYHTDSGRLKQVISNLLDNAMKFTTTGSITLGYEYTADHKLKIGVKDTGMGIDNNHLEFIFERFAQSDQGENQTIQGTGLGLAIYRGIVEKLGGNIWVESIPGEGSCFYILLPLPQDQYTDKTDDSENTPKIVPSLPAVPVKRVLIADDNESVQFYYRSILEDYKIEIVEARDGASAVRLFTENPNFDLLLMDINMPVKDGVTAMKEIRQLHPAAHIIAQSAFAMNEDVKKYTDAGFDQYITKPVPEEMLLRLLA